MGLAPVSQTVRSSQRGVRARSARPSFTALFILVSVVAATAATVAGALGLRPSGTERSAPHRYLSPSEIAPLPGGVDHSAGWNGRAFTQDNLWTSRDVQYALWVTTDGRPVVGRRTLGSLRWSTYDLSKIKHNPLRSPTERDEHNVYAIAVDAAGYVHVVGNMHGDPLRYVRSRRPGDIRSWSTQKMIGTQESRVTYPMFVRLSNGSLLFVYRDGESGDGDLYANVLAPGATRWARVGKIVDGRASGESPYPQHLAVDDKGNLHLMLMWRGTARPETTNDVSYAMSRDGGRKWATAAERPLASPLTHTGSDLAVDTPPSESGLLNSGGLEVDTRGRPHGAFVITERGLPSVRHVWFDGSTWRNDAVNVPGTVASRPAVVTNTKGSVYVLLLTRQEQSRALLLIDVTPGMVTRSVTLSEVSPAKWEPTFDTQALHRTSKLSLLVPTEKGGAVMTFDLTALASK